MSGRNAYGTTWYLVPWEPEDDADMSRLWLEGLSASKIGEELNPKRTKNSVLGRAHRLGLPTRAPVRNFAGTQRERTVRMKKSLPSMAGASFGGKPRLGTPEGDAVMRAIWATHTKTEIARYFGRHDTTLDTHRDRLGLPPKIVVRRPVPRGIAAAMPARKPVEPVETVTRVITPPEPATPSEAPVAPVEAVMPVGVAPTVPEAAHGDAEMRPWRDLHSARACQEIVGAPSGYGVDYRVAMCGQPVKGASSYCQHHRGINYTRRNSISSGWVPGMRAGAVTQGRGILEDA